VGCDSRCLRKRSAVELNTKAKASHDAGDALQIGVWGATSSGKTTYLAALDTAALREQNGQWRMLPDDLISEDFLVAQKASLERGIFPDATLRRSPEYTFTFTADINERIQEHRALFGTRTTLIHRQVKFKLLVRDFPGPVFERRARSRDGEVVVGSVSGAIDPATALAEQQHAFEEVGAFLAACHGIIYLFDPVREQPAAERERIPERMSAIHPRRRPTNGTQCGSLPGRLPCSGALSGSILSATRNSKLVAATRDWEDVDNSDAAAPSRALGGPTRST
jgi:hypothetical protein